MEKEEKRVFSVFLDSSKRPKITPRHESAVIVMLENDYSPGKVKTMLQKLEHNQILRSIKRPIEDVGYAKFYFLSQYGDENSLQKIQKKIEKSAKWIQKYSDKKITKMLGDHLHDVVKAELRAQGFEIMGENTRKYAGRKWIKTNQTLDIIGKHKQRNLSIGVEIKNMLPLAPVSEILSKIEMCEYFGIVPVFACRWLEQHRNEIESRKGFLWQFKKQLYPRGQEKFVELLRKRFKFPLEVTAELPLASVKEFENWMKSFPE